MTCPINIYSLSRIHEELPFNIVENHSSQKSDSHKTQYHEMESLRILVDNLIRHKITIAELDGFFYGFCIPQIGKEFDLLKFTERVCLNIELKSTRVSDEQILEQLLKNQHYLSHLGKRQNLYTVITDEMVCYKLSMNNELIEIDFSEICECIKMCSSGFLNDIDDMFHASHYLVSPINTPDKFIQGEYFLTQAQETIKKELLYKIDRAFIELFFHITGKPGTGKTLLLYDIAKTLSKNGKTAIVHCGKISSGQIEINNSIKTLDIIPIEKFRNPDFTLEKYSFILVDESHRIYTDHFDRICKTVESNFQICIFSSDPEQVLSSAEKNNAIVEKIKHLRLDGEYTLSEKIRTNKELHSFIQRMKNLNYKPKEPMNYLNVFLNYANTTDEAQNLLDYYRKEKGFVFINYSKSNYERGPYDIYQEDFDTHHVIGQEFDKVVMLMDSSFYYDEHGNLQGIPHPNPNYLYPNLFYQGVTRVREQLAIVVFDNRELFEKIVTIVA